MHITPSCVLESYYQHLSSNDQTNCDNYRIPSSITLNIVLVCKIWLEKLERKLLKRFYS